MKAINALYDALKKRREERQIYRAIRDLEDWVARDIGLEADHARRRAYRL